MFKRRNQGLQLKTLNFGEQNSYTNLNKPVLHCFRCLQFAFSNKQVYMASIFGQVYCLLSGCVTTSNNRQSLPLKQWGCSVTYCTSTDPSTPKFVFTRQPKFLSSGSCCYDKAMAFYLYMITKRAELIHNLIGKRNTPRHCNIRILSMQGNHGNKKLTS